MFFNVLIDKIKKCLTCNLATIAFFCGHLCKLETLCKKVTFSVTRTFYL